MIPVAGHFFFSFDRKSREIAAVRTTSIDFMDVEDRYDQHDAAALGSFTIKLRKLLELVSALQLTQAFHHIILHRGT